MVVACKKISRALKLLCLTTILLSLVGCAQSDALQENAAVFVKRALTVPSDQFAEIKALNLTPDNSEQYDEYVTKAIGSIGDSLVSKDVIENSNSTLYQHILLLHSIAAFEGYTYHVDQVSVTKVGNQKNYRYEAEITASNIEDKILLIGSIQFDENDLINYFSIEQPS